MVFILVLGIVATNARTPIFAEKPNANLTQEKMKPENIRMLKVPDVDKMKAKNKGLAEHKEAIKLLEKFIKENNINIIVDLDNERFQRFIKQFAFGHQVFTEEENKKIVGLVKFIDLYENYEQNNKLKKYKDKLKNNENLTKEELEDLNALNPISEDEPSTMQVKELYGFFHELFQNLNGNIVAAGSYSGTKARDYAYTWWDDRNNTQYGYYSKYYNCYDCWNDCTNFVSQALKYGGKTEMNDPYFASDQWQWYYRDWPKPSNSWGGAHNFYNHWKHWATLAKYDIDLVVGDVVNADFSGDGHIDHTAIVTLVSNGNLYVTQHTSDKKDAPLSAWFSSGYKVYGWKMGTDSH